jgi:hypothetical protein
MAKNHLLHDYIHQGDTQLGNTALHVSASLDGNPNFKTAPPAPISPGDLATQAKQFLDAVAVCEDGTTQDTLHKNNLRAALTGKLDALIIYIEANANNDPEVMASTGFRLANAAGGAPAPVGTVSISSVTNSAAGCLLLSLIIGANVWGFEMQVSTALGVWVPAGYCTDPRNVVIKNLTPGTLYAIRVRVHGSRNQVSEWSDSVSHMAM